ncbi:MAG TPA: hydrogenase formation protein HypD [Candidatus Aenigmarchaeota archaeon]|nr:hydrogenase formation protein HypD [Candidatus Aenigmarchaeota archaeon]
MKYLSEYRDKKLAKKILHLIREKIRGNWKIMEVCGGQAWTIINYGIDKLLPRKITLVHGPGCPVCVTPVEIIDKAIALAKMEEVILCSYSDMLRVPGSEKDLLTAKSEGADIRVVYSPLDVIKIAKQNPLKKIVFFAIGFETTVPGNAITLEIAEIKSINNVYLLVSQLRIPPALELILASSSIHGLLAPGHVCTIMGYKEYEEIANKYEVPIVVTGFEPIDLLEGILILIEALENKEIKVFNQYKRSVKRNGNLEAKSIIDKFFEIKDQEWRGLGLIPRSGFYLREEYKKYNAENLLKSEIKSKEKSLCIAGEILQGIKKPTECKAYRKLCTPSRPLGAPMVSAEGICAAYYNSGR